MNTAHTQRHAISPRQIKAIHTVKGKLGIDQEAYWQRLRAYGCKDRDCGDKLPPHPTCKDLTWRQAEELLEQLNGGSAPLTNRAGAVPERSRWADLDGRPGFCNGKQARMIEAMWSGVTWAKPEDRESALWKFMHRICGVDHFRFLRSNKVQALVKAINVMKKAKGGAR
jgi:hypothetical protein